MGFDQTGAGYNIIHFQLYTLSMNKALLLLLLTDREHVTANKIYRSNKVDLYLIDGIYRPNLHSWSGTSHTFHFQDH